MMMIQCWVAVGGWFVAGWDYYDARARCWWCFWGGFGSKASVEGDGYGLILYIVHGMHAQSVEERCWRAPHRSTPPYASSANCIADGLITIAFVLEYSLLSVHAEYAPTCIGGLRLLQDECIGDSNRPANFQ